MVNEVIVLTGQTGVGKTKVSLELAKKLNCEIINCDASQFKKYLNIGTAKIDLKTTDVIHHLIDIIEPDQYFSVADFQKKSRELIADILSRGKTPLLVGGSGLYISACIYDYNFSENKRSENSSYTDLDNIALHQILEKLDFKSSQEIHPNNRNRVLRAIELAESGVSISENKCSLVSVYNTLSYCIINERDIVYDNINKRVKEMIVCGFIEECQNLKKLNYDISKITDIGYQEIFKYLDNVIDIEETIRIISQKTRNYAKRQMTWFKNKMNLKFINFNSCLETILEEVRAIEKTKEGSKI